MISSNLSAKDSSRFSVGLGIFNYMEDGSPPHNDQSGMINLELHGTKAKHHVRKQVLIILMKATRILMKILTKH